MKLHPCKHCGAPAVEQTRKHLTPEDHRQQRKNEHGQWEHDPDYREELHAENENDIRVSCAKCQNATGWQKRDAPGMPEVGVGFTRNLWNECHGRIV